MKYFSSLLALVLVLSLLTPFTAAATGEGAQPFGNGPSNSELQVKAAIAEQLRTGSSGPKLHKDLQGLSGDEEVDVIIQLSEKPVGLERGIQKSKGKAMNPFQANKVKSNVRTQQSSAKKAMKARGISFAEKFTYDTVLNGFSATVKADDVDKLLDIEGVTLVEPDVTVEAFDEPSGEQPETDAPSSGSLSFPGIEALWQEGLEGQGVKVAVLDTGIDPDHPEFEGVYKGGKNFVAHNSSLYTTERKPDDASETRPSERAAGQPEFNANGESFYTSHGTHVAGIIAAIGANDYGIKGIAPQVDLYAYRVLGAYGSGATSSILAGIEEAVNHNMDIINLSFGVGANTETDAAAYAINNAMMEGTIAVLATGNTGPERGTMGTPSTSRLGIAVGNTTSPETMHAGQVNVQAGDYELAKPVHLMATTFGASLSDQLAGEFEVVAVPGIGAAADYETIDANGKVALVSRGEIAFIDKIAAAQQAGAVAVLIHNNEGGSNAPAASGTYLGDSFEFIPSFDLSQTDGEALRSALESSSGTVTFGDFTQTLTIGDEVHDTSSRGPSMPNFDIKPDVSAPGTNVMSTIPMYQADFPGVSYEEAYTRKTGTSMAAPHVTAIAALVKQANPQWDAFDVKVALSNTADVLDTNKFDVFAQGAGRVNAYEAAHPEILAYAQDQAVLDEEGDMVDHEKGTITFGPQSLEDGAVSVTKQVMIKDITGNGGNYDVTIDETKSFEGAAVTVDQSSFTLNGEQLLNVTLTAPQTAEPKAGDELLGYLYISNGDTEISLPFAADFSGEPTAVTDISISETDMSFDEDGVKDAADLSFTLTGDLATNYIEIWDIMNPYGGPYGDGYIGYVHASDSLKADDHTFTIDGQYQPWDGSPATTIPDGLYTFDIKGVPVSGKPSFLHEYAGPVIVKTTAPEITGTVTDGQATGQVDDMYSVYKQELVLYGATFDLNEKLHASYTATQKGKPVEPVAFDLAQDGSFTFPVSEKTDSVTVTVKDAAGNVGEAVIYEKEKPGNPYPGKPDHPGKGKSGKPDKHPGKGKPGKPDEHPGKGKPDKPDKHPGKGKSGKPDKHPGKGKPGKPDGHPGKGKPGRE
ncbi:S8 family serine peptidase [Planococcus salinus]|nr:S8 family serine peptidase [Planococcus salinus]